VNEQQCKADAAGTAVIDSKKHARIRSRVVGGYLSQLGYVGSGKEYSAKVGPQLRHVSFSPAKYGKAFDIGIALHFDFLPLRARCLARRADSGEMCSQLCAFQRLVRSHGGRQHSAYTSKIGIAVAPMNVWISFIRATFDAGSPAIGTRVCREEEHYVAFALFEIGHGAVWHLDLVTREGELLADHRGRQFGGAVLGHDGRDQDCGGGQSRQSQEFQHVGLSFQHDRRGRIAVVVWC
jgi:hypothetical protein